MSEAHAHTAVIPKPVRTARVVMYVQAVLMFLGAALLITMIVDSTDHGQEVPPLIHLIVVVNVLAAVGFVICAARIKAGDFWVRPVGLVLEALAFCGTLINVFTGAPQGVIGVALSILAFGMLVQAESREYFTEADGGYPA